MSSPRDSNHFHVPFMSAPYHTNHVVGEDDFRTTNSHSFVRHSAHVINRTVYDAAKQRRTHQAVNCKLDPPYRLWLSEKECRRKDYVKFKFEKRGLHKHDPARDLPSKKDIRNRHRKNEVDDYHLSQNVELCDVVIHPEHKLGLHAHANMYHDPNAASHHPHLHINEKSHSPSLPSPAAPLSVAVGGSRGAVGGKLSPQAGGVAVAAAAAAAGTGAGAAKLPVLGSRSPTLPHKKQSLFN